MKIHVYLERQGHLAVCRLSLDHRWFWSSCYEGVVPLIGRNLQPNEVVEFDLEATNVQTITGGIPVIKSKKLKMGLSYAAVSSLVAWYVSVHYPSIPWQVISSALFSGAWIVVTNMKTHAETDIAYLNKK